MNKWINKYIKNKNKHFRNLNFSIEQLLNWSTTAGSEKERYLRLSPKIYTDEEVVRSRQSHIYEDAMLDIPQISAGSRFFHYFTFSHSTTQSSPLNTSPLSTSSQYCTWQDDVPRDTLGRLERDKKALRHYRYTFKSFELMGRHLSTNEPAGGISTVILVTCFTLDAAKHHADTVVLVYQVTRSWSHDSPGILSNGVISTFRSVPRTWDVNRSLRSCHFSMRTQHVPYMSMGCF